MMKREIDKKYKTLHHHHTWFTIIRRITMATIGIVNKSVFKKWRRALRSSELQKRRLINSWKGSQSHRSLVLLCYPFVPDRQVGGFLGLMRVVRTSVHLKMVEKRSPQLHKHKKLLIYPRWETPASNYSILHNILNFRFALDGNYHCWELTQKF